MQIVFSRHALARLSERGITKEEVESAINSGERVTAKRRMIAYRKNFRFASKWKNRYYETKQVMPIVIEKEEKLIVVTVYAFYFGGSI